MPKMKAVLFDFDDTLVNSYPTRLRAAQRAAEGILEPSIELDRIMREWSGRPQREIWGDLSGDDDKAEALMGRYLRCYWDEMSLKVEPFPGIISALRELAQGGLALGIVTSKVRLRHDNGRPPYGALVEMRRLGVEELFDVVVGWEDVRESKPAPGPVLFALEKLGVGPRDAVMVGDSHIDITAAKRAGAFSAGAAWGTPSRELLVQAAPDHLLESPADLPSLVT